MGRFDLCFGLPMSSLGAILMPVFQPMRTKNWKSLCGLGGRFLWKKIDDLIQII